MQLTLARPVRLRVARLSLSILDVAAIAVLTVSAGVRIALVIQGWPGLNSDEAALGLMALHIARHGETPIFVYGQSYVGALEAYLAAPLFLVFGASTPMLHVGAVVFYTLFLGALYLLGCLLYNRKVALVSIAILSLGTLEMLYRQLEASGGYMEMLFFATVALLLASWLVLSVPGAEQSKRGAAYVGVGLAWGLGFWSHFIVLSAVAASAVLLLAFRRDELRTRASLWLLAGLFVGLLPVILHDLSTFPNHTAVGTLFRLYAAGGTGAIHVHAPFGQRLAGAMLVGLPIMTGARPVCALPPQEAWPISAHLSTHAVLCTAIHGAWSGAFIALWLAAAVSAVVALRRTKISAPHTHDRSPAGALHGCRLAVLATAGVALTLYSVSAAPVLDPRFSSRYLIVLWIAAPCLVALLWPSGRGLPVTLLNSGKVAIIAGLLLLMLLGTIDTFNQVSYTQWQTWEQEALISRLEHMGATRIYTDYWTCYRMIFQSRERVLCAALDEHLRPAEDRYPPYRDIVRRDPRAWYVFPLQTTYQTAIARRMAHTRRRYRRFVSNFYVVYQPETAVNHDPSAANVAALEGP